ncbi:pilus assembly protein TadE [Cupriavidus sp. USMAA2-4]|uniref:Pilus assembly protein TadE n=1 Tax=Cupriavidus malaysiensis TaxID=367825 RepID=A0ABM6F202_9BURK|nr:MULTISPECIES: TadE/TadG family type IV pilus assembly protein [Cupriavidus]AOY91697.1 pilus assembly protein TadE [Cupriavidus sp. USMAA2-4]AOY98745.1 pilus assembly protein TadE [Cupriavidus sp. USMAHM13]AOZ05178.1 pilus assembly protein TadE [Cupriavidus malaysiensis]
MRANLRPPARQHGQAAVEFIVIAPLLLFFCLGILQFALLYQAKATLDYATLQAAREGAVNHGSLESMRIGLARGLAPLYARAADADGSQAAFDKARADVRAHSVITLVSPTPAMLRDFGQPVGYDGKTFTEIANDTLYYRNTRAGRESGVNIQDANLLKIRALYCYDMYVPLANKVFYYVANVIGNIGSGGILTREPAEPGDPYGRPANPDSPCLVKLEDGIETGRWPLALESEALVRMQSPFRGGK